MTQENENFVGKYVEIVEDGCGVPKGRKGIVTADLKEHNAFAVWFDEPIGSTEDCQPLHWARFEWQERNKFAIIGDRTQELTEALRPFTSRIEQAQKS